MREKRHWKSCSVSIPAVVVVWGTFAALSACGCSEGSRMEFSIPSHCSIYESHAHTMPQGEVHLRHITPIGLRESVEQCVESCCLLGPSACQYAWLFEGKCFAVACSDSKLDPGEEGGGGGGGEGGGGGSDSLCKPKKMLQFASFYIRVHFEALPPSPLETGDALDNRTSDTPNQSNGDVPGHHKLTGTPQVDESSPNHVAHLPPPPPPPPPLHPTSTSTEATPPHSEGAVPINLASNYITGTTAATTKAAASMPSNASSSSDGLSLSSTSESTPPTASATAASTDPLFGLSLSSTSESTPPTASATAASTDPLFATVEPVEIKGESDRPIAGLLDTQRPAVGKKFIGVTYVAILVCLFGGALFVFVLAVLFGFAYLYCKSAKKVEYTVLDYGNGKESEIGVEYFGQHRTFIVSDSESDDESIFESAMLLGSGNGNGKVWNQRSGTRHISLASGLIPM